MIVLVHIHILRDRPTDTEVQRLLYLQVVVMIVAVSLSVIMRSVDTLGRVARYLELLVEARVWNGVTLGPGKDGTDHVVEHLGDVSEYSVSFHSWGRIGWKTRTWGRSGP